MIDTRCPHPANRGHEFLVPTTPMLGTHAHAQTAVVTTLGGHQKHAEFAHFEEGKYESATPPLPASEATSSEYGERKVRVTPDVTAGLGDHSRQHYGTMTLQEAQEKNLLTSIYGEMLKNG